MYAYHFCITEIWCKVPLTSNLYTATDKWFHEISKMPNKEKYNKFIIWYSRTCRKSTLQVLPLRLNFCKGYVFAQKEYAIYYDIHSEIRI